MGYVLWILWLIVGGAATGYLIGYLNVPQWFQLVLCVILGGLVGLGITAIFKTLNLI